MIEKLHDWQAQCLERINESFNAGNGRFFCLVDISAGKTFLLTEFAKRLLEAGSIDMVLIFCPSLAIQKIIQDTFSEDINARLGDTTKPPGYVMTYQSMLFQSESFWEMLKIYRVLVIFDGIQYCFGPPFSGKNTWGTRILDYIAEKSRFVLCLSDTPWTNHLPITKAFSDHHQQIRCDFFYDLADAANDGISRMPSVTLIDNNKTPVSPSRCKKSGCGSVADSFMSSELKYKDVLTDVASQRYILKRSVEKLNELRQQDSKASGMVVAKSISHAIQLTRILRYEYYQDTAVISYPNPNSTESIDIFRVNNPRWFVCVGMPFEGDNISTLQVCCLLGDVLDDIYFRQLLGRILRKNNEAGAQEFGCLYAFDDLTLRAYTMRLKVDIPDMEVTFERMQSESEINLNDLGDTESFSGYDTAYEDDHSSYLNSDKLQTDHSAVSPIQA